MPNVAFEERHGASLLRRIIAGLWIVLTLGGAITLVNYTPRLYRGELEICYNEGNKGEVLSRVESVIKNNNISNINIESAGKERIIVFATNTGKKLVNNNLLVFKDLIKESIRADVESKYNTDKEEFDNQLSALNQKLSLLQNNQQETEEFYNLITELKTGLKDRTPLPVGWEMMFSDNPRYKSIMQEITENITAIEELHLELKTEAAKMLVLSDWVNSPENQVVQITEKRVVHYEDTPELIALKDRKAEIEASRMRLLQRATTRHPAVIRMSEEIDELQAQINALIRSPQIVEDVKEITNPEVAEFNRKIITTRGNIAALNSRLDTITARTLSRLDDLKILVSDAQKDKDSSHRERLENEIENFKKSPVRIGISPIIGYIISGNFTRIDSPNLLLIYSLAGFIGVVGAFLIMYSSKKSSFKLEEVEATPEFPVLGKIGKIGGSKIIHN